MDMLKIIFIEREKFGNISLYSQLYSGILSKDFFIITISKFFNK